MLICRQSRNDFKLTFNGVSSSDPTGGNSDPTAHEMQRAGLCFFVFLKGGSTSHQTFYCSSCKTDTRCSFTVKGHSVLTLASIITFSKQILRGIAYAARGLKAYGTRVLMSHSLGRYDVYFKSLTKLANKTIHIQI